MLNSLEIVNGSISPEFKSDVFEYIVDVSDEVLSLVLRCEAENDAIITVHGNNNLTEGENHVLIEVYQGKVTTYTLKVMKSVSDEVTNLQNTYDKIEVNADNLNRDYLTPIIGISCFFTIIALFCIIFKKK